MTTKFFYPLAFLLFFFDVCCFAFFEQQLIFSLLCCVISQLLQHPLFFLQNMYGILLLIMQSCVYYGTGMPALFMLPPLILLGIATYTHLQYSPPLRYFLLICCLLIHCVCISTFLFSNSCSMAYTFSIIFVNLIVMFFIP